MTPNHSTYAQFDKIRQSVSELLGKLASSFLQLESNKRAESLLLTQKSLLEDAFRILILGEFSRGKSTLINAILGENVLPMKIAPCTAVITKVCFGESKKALLQFRDGQKEVLDLVTIPDALKKRITINDDSHSPIEYCEVQYPLPLLRNGVEIVDSPGLNESEIRSEITCGFFAQSDAMIFVLNCEHAMAASERSFIDNELRDRDLRDVFFLWNRFDAIRESPEDIADIQRLSREKLESRLNGQMRVFYISARDALRGRLNSDLNALEASNIQSFETALEDFLTKERGRVKLRGPLKLAMNAVKQGLNEVLPNRENLAKTPLQALKTLYAEQAPKLESAERMQAKIVRAIDRRGEAIKRQSKSMIQLIHSEMESGIIRICNQADIKFLDAALQQESARNRLIEQYSKWATPRLNAWKANEYDAFLRDSFAELESELSDEVQDLVEVLNSLQTMVNESTHATESAIDPNKSLRPADPPATGNNLSKLFDLATDDRVNGVAATGLTLAAGIGIAIFHLPVLIVASSLLALGAGNALFGAKKRVQQVRDNAIAFVTDALETSRHKMTNATTEMIDSKLNLIRSQVTDRLGFKVDEARSQVEAAIRKKEEAESKAETELARLASVRQNLQDIEAELQAVASLYSIE